MFLIAQRFFANKKKIRKMEYLARTNVYYRTPSTPIQEDNGVSSIKASWTNILTKPINDKNVISYNKNNYVFIPKFPMDCKANITTQEQFFYVRNLKSLFTMK
jgi:hypothetical protein